MATVDITNGKQPEGVHAGLNVLVCRISLSVSVSAGDIHLIGKLPANAIPLDCVFYGGTAFTNTSLGHVMKIGTSASQDMFFASATYSITNSSAPTIRNTRLLGTRVQNSLSDDAMPRYDNIVLVNTAPLMSVGYMGDFVLTYKMPGQTL